MVGSSEFALKSRKSNVHVRGTSGQLSEALDLSGIE